MTAPRTRRLAAIVLAVSALAALLPAGASAASPARARDAAPAATVDTLWATGASGLEVCADPSSSASLATCFASGSRVIAWPMATDGVNVYAKRAGGGAWSCPIASAGADCAAVAGGPWSSSAVVKSFAAADGVLWIGQDNGKVYRCPSDLPYVDGNTAPSSCQVLDDAGKSTYVQDLLLANGRLYAALSNGILWSCDPHVANACLDLDDASPGFFNSVKPVVLFSLAAGAGFLWVGRGDGVLWRCDPYLQDRCATWDTAGGRIYSLSYDGAGTLYAAVGDPNDSDNGTIWSCPVATKDACSEVIPDVNGISVAAGAGGVFSSNYTSVDSPLHFGTTPFTGATTAWNKASLLYIPATGPVGLGAVHAQVRFPEAAKRLAARCADGVPHMARVRVRGPHAFLWKRTVDICRVRNVNMPKIRLYLLDPGTYHVRIRTEKHAARATVVVPEEATRRVILRLAVVR